MKSFSTFTVLAFLVASFVIWSCEEGVVIETRDLTRDSGCTPGQQQDCRCSGGRTGVQFCTETGQAWSECFCADAAKVSQAPDKQRNGAESSKAQAASKLAVVWYSDDPYVAERVCLMYSHNAKKLGWFDTVELIVWGPSQQLLVQNSEIQSVVAQMMNDGVIVEACRACADLYGVTAQLEALGITVKYMGQPLTNMLQSDWEVLTF
ncbi:MAG: hypothetical protein QNJ97_15180 [Myxococcota bacterium]|nr:hypothetical protein [Myxococcota bacterium]